MDIHRARFVPYPPSAINALAFSHAQNDDNNEDSECLRLAIGRANGNIEIWNPAKGAWLQERVFSGGKDRSVEGLTWIQEPDEKTDKENLVPGRLRLFSIGYSSSITEWDLVTGLPARHSDGNQSEVWCFAAQPRPKVQAKKDALLEGNSKQNLVAGCADGTLVLLSTADNDLRFDRFLSRSSAKKARVLSVIYKDRNTVVAGFANSTIRVYDTRNGSVIRNISLGSGPPGGPKEILVWKVKCLLDGDLVSGDSTGDIRIFDGKNYSQVQRISGHEADVLDLAVSQDGTMIFSGGMDRRTCFYTCSKKKVNRGEKWRKVSHKRYHDHDVKALASYEGSQLSIIVSGGIDTQPVVLPLRQFGKELSRGLLALPRDPSVVSAPRARLVISWWNCELRIWRIKNQLDGVEKPKVVARLALQGDENITSASVTRDGGLFAVATARQVKLFQLITSKAAAGPGLRIRKLEIPTMTGARLVRFAADGKWLTVMTPTNQIQIARIKTTDDLSDRPRVLEPILHLHRLPRDSVPWDSLNGPWGSYNRTIAQAEFSADGRIFAVADLAGYLDTWVLEGHEDPTAPEMDFDESAPSQSAEDDEDEDEDEVPSGRATIYGQRWIRNPSGHLLPRLDSAPLLLSFQPKPASSARPEPNGNPAVHPTRHNPHPHSHALPEEHQLLVVSAEHRLYHFGILAGRLSDWSRRNPPSSYPSPFRLLDVPVKGCTWDTSDNKNRVWLYGEKWLYMFDLTKDMPLSGAVDLHQLPNGTEEAGMAVTRKRKREPVRAYPRKNNSGAGDVVPVKETPVTKMRRFNSGKADESSSTWLDLNNTRGPAESDDDYEDKHQALASLRRCAGANGVSSTTVNGDYASDGKEAGSEEERRGSHASSWHTFKYRPILGMVPVEGDSGALEVVLVERPSFDLDLPPRFVGSHE